MANGLSWFHVGEPVAVAVKLFADESVKGAPETQLKSAWVFVIAVNGAVGGVKLLVYKAVPFNNLKFETYPVKGNVFPNPVPNNTVLLF